MQAEVLSIEVVTAMSVQCQQSQSDESSCSDRSVKFEGLSTDLSQWRSTVSAINDNVDIELNRIDGIADELQQLARRCFTISHEEWLERMAVGHEFISPPSSGSSEMSAEEEKINVSFVAPPGPYISHGQDGVPHIYTEYPKKVKIRVDEKDRRDSEVLGDWLTEWKRTLCDYFKPAREDVDATERYIIDPLWISKPVIALQWTSMYNFKICFEEFRKTGLLVRTFWLVWNIAEGFRNQNYISPSVPSLADIGFWAVYWSQDKVDHDKFWRFLDQLGET